MSGRRVGWVAVLGALALCGCELGDSTNGGGGGGQQTTVNLSSPDSLDGSVGSNGASATNFGSALTGDISSLASVGFRQFFSFDISGIPSGSTIVSATLRLHQAGVTGSPYTLLGNVMVAHVVYGDTLDAPDYTTPALAAPVTLSTNTMLEFKQISVTARVQADLSAARPRSQFRLQFSSADFSNNSASDFVQFTDAGALGNDPVLVVTYIAP